MNYPTIQDAIDSYKHHNRTQDLKARTSAMHVRFKRFAEAEIEGLEAGPEAELFVFKIREAMETLERVMTWVDQHPAE